MDQMLDDLRVEMRGDVATLDLSHLRFIRPAHMVGIAAQADLAAGFGRPFRLIKPTFTDPGIYAARMHLNRVLDELAAEHDLPTVRDHQNQDLLEVSRIVDASGVRDLAAMVHAKVEPVDPAIAAALHQGLCELGANVTEHARAVGFVAAQRMPGLNELRFAVADAGLGVLRTLQPKGADNDRDAIGMALDGVSRFDEPERGGGLKSVASAAGALEGRIYVASGVTAALESATSRTFSDGAHAFQGTLIEVTILLSRGRHARRFAAETRDQ